MDRPDKNKNSENRNPENKKPANKKPANKNQINRDLGSRRKSKSMDSIERTVLYAVSIILLGFVIALAVKNYRLSGRLEELSDSTAEASATESDTATEATTKSEKLTLVNEPEYLTIEPDVNTATGQEVDTYNGDDLASNGCTYAIKINRQENIVTVYKLGDDGYYTVPVKVMRCSVSPDGETPLGIFNVAGKWTWLALYDYCYGQYVSQIEGDTLFHSVPYLDTSKDTLETWEFNKLGTDASLGCVRLCVADAKWIYENCETGTYVDIFDSDYYGPLGRPVPVTKLADTENAGWDPTDMVEENPTTGTGVIYGVESHSIKLGENYDTMAGVWAFNSDRQDVTSELKVEGTVDNTCGGDYKVKYSFEDKSGTVSKEITITVEDDEAPVITRVPLKLTVQGYDGQKEELAQLIASYVTASDNGTEITAATQESSLAPNTVAICVNSDSVGTEAGSYTAVCYAVDGSGNRSAEYTIDIEVTK